MIYRSYIRTEYIQRREPRCLTRGRFSLPGQSYKHHSPFVLPLKNRKQCTIRILNLTAAPHVWCEPTTSTVDQCLLILGRIHNLLLTIFQSSFPLLKKMNPIWLSFVIYHVHLRLLHGDDTKTSSPFYPVPRGE
jgi:hypothetical protein